MRQRLRARFGALETEVRDEARRVVGHVRERVAAPGNFVGKADVTIVEADDAVVPAGGRLPSSGRHGTSCIPSPWMSTRRRIVPAAEGLVFDLDAAALAVVICGCEARAIASTTSRFRNKCGPTRLLEGAEDPARTATAVPASDGRPWPD
jgi:hypothetical protein